MAPKKADKVKDDKTFGMKNKKGGKAQQQIKIIQQQQQQAGKNREALAKEKKKEEEKRLKAEAEKARALDPLLNIVQPRVPFGVDPKTITCAFWAAGKCDKGNRCKFAHAKDAGRKVEKKDLYTDTRDTDPEAGPSGENGAAATGENGAADDRKLDTMDKWDRAKLDSVILSKHGNPKSTTDKVCKYFLQAVEDGKYGWFWECPNGNDKCMYRHKLPQGFVLKAQKKELDAEAKANEISLEEFLESARHQLGSNLTPVNKDTFAEWKQRRMNKRQAEEEAMESKKKQQAQANKMHGLSGREVFTLNPTMFEEEYDDGAAGDEFDMTMYLKNWEQAREEENRAMKGDEGSDDENEDDDDERQSSGHANGVSETTQKLSEVAV